MPSNLSFGLEMVQPDVSFVISIRFQFKRKGTHNAKMTNQRPYKKRWIMTKYSNEEWKAGLNIYLSEEKNPQYFAWAAKKA